MKIKPQQIQARPRNLSKGWLMQSRVLSLIYFLSKFHSQKYSIPSVFLKIVKLKCYLIWRLTFFQWVDDLFNIFYKHNKVCISKWSSQGRFYSTMSLKVLEPHFKPTFWYNVFALAIVKNNLLYFGRFQEINALKQDFFYI